MKLFIALFAVMAVASAYPSRHNNHNVQEYEHHEQVQKHIPIVKYESEQNKDSYQYGYEAGNGIVAAENGVVKNAGQKDAAVAAEGFYSYVGTDGKTYAVKYIADENGFRAVGDHIPTPPPVPAEIQEALAKIASQPQQHYQEEQEQYYEVDNSENNEEAHYYVQRPKSGRTQKW